MSSIIYRQIEPSEIAAVASLAREVFDQFVAPHYQPDGILEFHRYASADALSQRHDSGHVTLVAEHSGELVSQYAAFARPLPRGHAFHPAAFPAQGHRSGTALLRPALSLATQTASSPSIRPRMSFLPTNI